MMAKPKAPEWLRLAFKDGVDEREGDWALMSDRAYPLARPRCQLAQHDPLELPCSGRLERFHFVNRQRIENAMGALLPPRCELSRGGIYPYSRDEVAELILLAAWDPRVGGISCEAHHRRLDGALTPPLIVPYGALPSHVTDWAADFGLESQLEARYPSEVASV